jgi:cell wall-associated NlpC family hydrolase
MMRAFIFSTVLLFSAGVAHAQKAVIGQLGQTTAAARFYAAPDEDSRVYYRAQPYEYVCVNWGNDQKWMKVLMSNGKQGFVLAEHIAVLPYRVTQSAPTGRSSGREMGSISSRGGVAGRSLQYVGTPYVWGGNDLSNGIDCSGFVKKLYGQIGLNLPRTASEQAKVGKPITRLEHLQPGDRLYFWEAKRGKIGHTGIYLGGNYFVHSSRGHRGVATDILSEKWRRILVAARR